MAGASLVSCHFCHDREIISRIPIGCLRFADFITNDSTISKVIAESFEYIHVNYNPRKSGSERLRVGEQSSGMEQQQQSKALMKRLNNCGRFGFPVFVVLDQDGKVIHIQDSSFLEDCPSGTSAERQPVVDTCLGNAGDRIAAFYAS